MRVQGAPAPCRVQGGALACRALLCGAVAALSLTATAALALEEPRPCTPSDARVRCIALARGAVVHLVAAPGAALLIQVPEGERVVGVPASDNALMRAPGASRSVAVAAEDGAEGDNRSVTDGNLSVAVRGPTVIVKPFGPLVAQPLFVLTERDGHQQQYAFQLETGPNWFFSVRLRNLEAEAAEQRAQWADIQRRREEQAARDKLDQELAEPCAAIPNVNRRYVGQGDAALAPAEICDDGRSVYAKFLGRIPVVNETLPDGRLAGVNVTQGNNGWMTIAGTAAILQLSDGGRTLCLHNRAYSTAIANTGTGTVSAGVVRERKP